MADFGDNDGRIGGVEMTTGAEKRNKYVAKSPEAAMGWGGAPDPSGITNPAIKQRASQHPSEPWLWRQDWADGRIHSFGRRDARLQIALGLVCAGVAAGVAFLLGSSPSTTPAMVVITAVLLLVGLAIAGFGVRDARQRARVGLPVLVLESVPIWVGGRLRGRIEWPSPTAPRNGFTIELRTVPIYRNDELFGDHRSNAAVIFSTSSEIAPALVQQVAHGYTIPLDLEVPSDQPGTGMRVVVGSTHGVLVAWELLVRPRDSDSSIRELFKLPVFAKRKVF